MKKIVLLSLAVVALAAPAFAADDAKMAPAATTAATADAKPVALKDGSWAKTDAKGAVSVSKDGKVWTAVKAGTVLDAKDGTKVTAK